MTPLAKKVFELFGKPELAAESESKSAEGQPSTSPPWPCPHCGRPAEIESVEPSLDRQRMLTYWHCTPCQVWAVTPDTINNRPCGYQARCSEALRWGDEHSLERRRRGNRRQAAAGKAMTSPWGPL